MIRTLQAYGFKLGGPGCWALKGTAPGDRLLTPWYDETNPTHDFSAQAIAQITPGLHRKLTSQQRREYESLLAFMFETAVEVSPPAWTREASAPPALAPHLPPSSSLLDLDRPAPPLHVLVVSDSVIDLDEIQAAYHDGDYEAADEQFRLHNPRIDWDSVLDAALTEIGLQMPGMPDWFWYRIQTAD